MVEEMKSNFKEIIQYTKEAKGKQGIFLSRKEILKEAIAEILGGFRDLEEARECKYSLKATGNIYFTAIGYKVNYKTLEEAIRKTEGKK